MTDDRPAPPYAILVPVPRETRYLATTDEHAAIVMQSVIRDALRQAGYRHPVVAIVHDRGETP